MKQAMARKVYGAQLRAEYSDPPALRWFCWALTIPGACVTLHALGLVISLAPSHGWTGQAIGSAVFLGVLTLSPLLTFPAFSPRVRRS